MSFVRVIAVAWSLLCLAVLVMGLTRSGGNAEIGVLCVIYMGFLNFPSSVISYLLLLAGFHFVTEVLGHSGTGRVAILVTWLTFFTLGYVQWFVLLPRIWRRAGQFREKGVEET